MVELVGLKQSAIAYWVKKGSIPSKWHSKIMSLANDNRVFLDASELSMSSPDESATAAVIGGNKILEQAHISVPTLETGEYSPFLFYASQSGMADIFEVDVRTINEHLQNIFNSGELLIMKKTMT